MGEVAIERLLLPGAGAAPLVTAAMPSEMVVVTAAIADYLRMRPVEVIG
jgi:hypothetical protein